MLTISKHPKGLLITKSGKEFEDINAGALRHILDVPVSSVALGKFLIPLSLAHLVLEHFGTNQADWETEILQIAKRQLDIRESQLRTQVEVEYAIENAGDILKDYALFDNLDPHQIEAVAAIISPSLRGIAIFDEQGTGKTIMTLCGYDYLYRQERIEKLLIIAPKSVLGGWESATQMLFGDAYRVRLVSGSTKKRRRDILGSHDILAISYETAVREEALLSTILAAKLESYMIVVDESYYVKNPKALRSQTVTNLREYCDRAVILCGTPTPNSPRDIIHQINIADQGVAFNAQIIPEDTDKAYAIIEESLKNTVYLRRLKHEVLVNLPDKQIERVKFDLQPIQQALYEKAKKDLVLALRSIDDIQFRRELGAFLARRSTLLQICSHPGSIDPLYDEVPAKQLVLDRMLEEIVEKANQKVVIWSYYRHSLQGLAERYEHYGVVRIDGSVTKLEARIDAIERFQRDPDIKIFLGNAAAAGAGITLTAAHHAIYESFSNQAAHYMQSVDRIHRRGQKHDVTIHILLANDTLEEKEFDRILRKENISRDLLGDRLREPITREYFLSDLGSTT